MVCTNAFSVFIGRLKGWPYLQLLFDISATFFCYFQVSSKMYTVFMPEYSNTAKSSFPKSKTELSGKTLFNCVKASIKCKIRQFRKAGIRSMDHYLAFDDKKVKKVQVYLRFIFLFQALFMDTGFSEIKCVFLSVT